MIVQEKTFINKQVIFISPQITFITPQITFINPQVTFISPQVTMINKKQTVLPLKVKNNSYYKKIAGHFQLKHKVYSQKGSYTSKINKASTSYLPLQKATRIS